MFLASEYYNHSSQKESQVKVSSRHLSANSKSTSLAPVVAPLVYRRKRKKIVQLVELAASAFIRATQLRAVTGSNLSCSIVEVLAGQSFAPIVGQKQRNTFRGRRRNQMTINNIGAKQTFTCVTCGGLCLGSECCNLMTLFLVNSNEVG